MAFTRRETSLVKGMIDRGDKQHDIAAFFGVNGGRVAEVSSGLSEYTAVAPANPGDLPPPPPYPSPYKMLWAKKMLEELDQEVLEMDLGAATAKSDLRVRLNKILKEI